MTKFNIKNAKKVVKPAEPEDGFYQIYYPYPFDSDSTIGVVKLGSPDFIIYMNSDGITGYDNLSDFIKNGGFLIKKVESVNIVV